MPTARAAGSSLSNVGLSDSKPTPIERETASYGAPPPPTTLPLRFRVAGMNANDAFHEIRVEELPESSGSPQMAQAPLSSHTLNVAGSEFHQYRIGQIFRLVLEHEPIMGKAVDGSVNAVRAIPGRARG